MTELFSLIGSFKKKMSKSLFHLKLGSFLKSDWLSLIGLSGSRSVEIGEERKSFRNMKWNDGRWRRGRESGDGEGIRV